MKKNTKKNREMLAARIVEYMDIDTMEEALRDQHEDFFEGHTDKEFDKVWKEVYGED